MLRYILSRIGQIAIVLVGVTLVTFILVNVVPGDPVQLMLNKRADEATINKVREELGFDKPLPEQYLTFLKNAVKGDFGDSYFQKVPATQMIMRSLKYTLKLALYALIVALIAGLLIGIIAAVFHNTIVDKLLMALSTVAISAPVFWIAVILQIIFGLNLKVLPISGVERAGSFVLPVIALSMGYACQIARITRTSMLEVKSQDYIRTARAKGAKEFWVILKHTFKNASIPIITFTGLAVRGLLGGSMLVETVFSIPGFGSLMVTSILTRDIPLIQGCVVYGAVIFVLTNLLVDIAYGFVDPRIRIGKEA